MKPNSSCPICKNSTFGLTEITVTLERGDTTLVYKNVPARVCEDCGEQFVDEATTRELLIQAESAAKAGVEVQVRSYAA